MEKEERGHHFAPDPEAVPRPASQQATDTEAAGAVIQFNFSPVYSLVGPDTVKSGTLMDQNKYQNELVVYRRRWGLGQKQVASLLGHRDTSMLSRYENGKSLPPLETALRLEIIYRVPVAFLYHKFYASLRDHIRAEEAMPTALRQQPLF